MMDNRLAVSLTVDELTSLITSVVQRELIALIPPPTEQLLTPKEVCTLLRISKTTLKKYTDQGRISVENLGARRKLYKKTSVMESLKTLKKYLPLKK